MLAMLTKKKSIKYSEQNAASTIFLLLLLFAMKNLANWNICENSHIHSLTFRGAGLRLAFFLGILASVEFSNNNKKDAIYECIDNGDFEYELYYRGECVITYIPIQMNRVKLAGWVKIRLPMHATDTFQKKKCVTERWHDGSRKISHKQLFYVRRHIARDRERERDRGCKTPFCK